jgi:hypothetical protein
MKRILLVILITFVFAQQQSIAQTDTLRLLSFENTVSFDFPIEHSDQSYDLRRLMEGRYNGVIYSFFISDEYNYTRIMNGLELDSLYTIIIGNTLQVYANDVVEHDSYNMNFGDLRGKFMQVTSTSKSNPYVAEYYLICVSGRIFILSATYLSNYTEAQIKQAKNLGNTIKFNEKLGYLQQMNRF